MLPDFTVEYDMSPALADYIVTRLIWFKCSTSKHPYHNVFVPAVAVRDKGTNGYFVLIEGLLLPIPDGQHIEDIVIDYLLKHKDKYINIICAV